MLGVSVGSVPLVRKYLGSGNYLMFQGLLLFVT